ncbi:MAG: Holliday junction branch migration protein RuvA [Candidatus Eisenbacteria bacterium]|uniref:Holliday junction branch migration complex subunit RuvA n=1 Tax=Eiseniibacteriota bacterium TaxID=2212470 RepID=A0A538TK07_UNCEI|nr:MAG: Holliday junction branch migration protein RuvA [Candidatus Eisenbacteria bacterium]
MIAWLRGTLGEKDAAHCVVEAGGVGYRVSVSCHTARALPDVGDPVFVYTQQVVREDAIQLFGFSDLEERRLFELLITVSGVGPKVALAVLSGLPPFALAKAIRDENLAALVGISGVGRKTAERLIVELRDKLDVMAVASGAAPAGGGVLPRSERFEDAVAALVRLGYSRPQATDAVRKVTDGEEDPSLEHLVRRALARLGKTAAGAR